MEGRHADLSIHEIGQELVVYDSSQQKTHLLNPPLAEIYRRLEIEPPEQIVADLYPALSSQERQTILADTLRQLSEARLIREQPRRQALQHMVAAGIVLPVLTSLALPRPAAAASCTPQASQPIAVLSADGSVSNTTAMFSTTICVPAGATVTLRLSLTGGSGSSAADRLDDAFALQVSGGGSFVYVGYDGFGGQCGGVPITVSTATIPPVDIDITSLVNPPAFGSIYRTLNFTHCNFFTPESFMPGATILIS